MKRICLVFMLSAILSNGYSQVYKSPTGAAEAATSNYKKLIIPDSLKSFYKRIDDIHDRIQKRPATFGEYSVTNTPRNCAETCSDRLLGSYVIYTDPDNTMPYYYDYMTAYTRGNYPEFLRLLNKSMETHFVMAENYIPDTRLNCWRNGTAGSYQMLLSRSVLEDCEEYKRKREQAVLLVAENMFKNISNQKNGWMSAIDLAMIYSFGCRPMEDGTLGTIDIDYQQSLRCLAQMEGQIYATSIPPSYVFLSKALKAYDLLQIGSMQKDVNTLRQASDIYIDLWQIASDNVKWNAIFTDMVSYVGQQNHLITIVYCDALRQVKTHIYAQHFDAYFLASIKLDLSLQIEKCCADIQALAPNAILGNKLTPVNYAVQIFRQFINDWAAQ